MSTNGPIRNALTVALRVSRSLGVEPPADLLEATAVDRAERRELQTHLETEAANLAPALAAALDAGRDPITCKAVTRALTAHQLLDTHAANRVDAVRQARHDQAVRAHTDALVAAWAPAVQAAGRTIHEHAHLPITEATPPESLRSDDLALWGRAREAAARLDEVVRAHALLAHTLHSRRVIKGMEVIAIADLTWQQYRQLTSAKQARGEAQVLRAIDVAAAGIELNLAGLTELAQRHATLEEQRVEEERREEFAAKMRKRPAIRA